MWGRGVPVPAICNILWEVYLIIQLTFLSRNCFSLHAKHLSFHISLYPLTSSRGKIFISRSLRPHLSSHFSFLYPHLHITCLSKFCTHLGPEVYFHWYFRTTTPLLPKVTSNKSKFFVPYIIVMPIFKCSFDCLIFVVSKY